jgi:hypothetical protein
MGLRGKYFCIKFFLLAKNNNKWSFCPLWNRFRRTFCLNFKNMLTWNILSKTVPTIKIINYCLSCALTFSPWVKFLHYLLFIFLLFFFLCLDESNHFFLYLSSSFFTFYLHFASMFLAVKSVCVHIVCLSSV